MRLAIPRLERTLLILLDLLLFFVNVLIVLILTSVLVVESLAYYFGFASPAPNQKTSIIGTYLDNCSKRAEVEQAQVTKRGCV